MIELKGKVAERFEKEREKAEKSPKTDVSENVEIVRKIVSETKGEGMKAEKLIKDYTKRCSNVLCAVEDKYGKKVISYHEWLTPEQALSAVQIEREEMVESITNILKSADYKDYISTIISGIGTIKFDSDRFVNDIIKDFKKAMEEQV